MADPKIRVQLPDGTTILIDEEFEPLLYEDNDDTPEETVY